jgi:hypothetical protein
MSSRRFSGKPGPVQAKGVAHELVAETAKDMARAIYEVAASESNEFYAKWPSMEGFVRARWSSFIQPARTHLAELLHPSRHSMTTPEMREQIHDALLKHAAVNPAANMIDAYVDGKAH